ncbi:hypothetical protein [Roseivirga sp.]|uniref:hypothetical protein n=1 Tax=Roseivirga sp. TaxID=1964215 RepID=UPI003BAA438A
MHISTNKVYADGPNSLNLIEKEFRWDYADESDYNGISKGFLLINQSTPFLVPLRFQLMLWSKNMEDILECLFAVYVEGDKTRFRYWKLLN